MAAVRRQIDTTAVLGVKVTCLEDASGASHDTPITVEMELSPGAESIIHRHPHQDERYEVIHGKIDLFVDGEWRQLTSGQTLTIPKGAAHAFRNSGGQLAKALNTHTPRLRFEEYLLVMEKLIRQGKITGVKGLKNTLYLSLHGVKYQEEVVAVRPPMWLISMGAAFARICGLRL
jgi:mannose-6-phosphate isomerase-like protein (cupin superfamily)